MKKKTTKEFIEQAKMKHEDKYDYSKSNYTGTHNKVCIICSEHGEFWQSAKAHLSGQGCPICNAGARIGKENFIKRSIEKHGNLYDYSKVMYLTMHDKVIITCKTHGDFEQRPYKHCNEGQGCPVCGQSKSIGEELIKSWLIKNNISFSQQFRILSNKIARSSKLMIVDFYINFNNKIYFIEYDGIQHFQYHPYFHKGGVIDFTNQQRRDKILEEFCKINDFNLIRFNYKMKDQEILNSLAFYFKAI